MGLLSSAAKSVGKLFNDVMGNTANNQFNAAEAEKNRQWQEMMSNTAHQRAVEDLQAAGLNPILSAMGNSASTPTGATATSSGYSNNSANFINETINAIANYKKADSEENKNNAEATYITGTQTDLGNTKIKHMNSEIGKNEAETKVLNSSVDKIASEIQYNSAKKALAEQQTETEKENTFKTHNEAWESLHRSQKYDSERAKNYGTKEGQFGLMYEGRHKFVKPSNSAKYYKGKFTL